MALTLGTNSGFVSEAPASDANPDATDAPFDNRVQVTGHTAPTGATTVTQIGWWLDNATQEANFEVALYDDSAGVPGAISNGGTSKALTNAKGTTGGYWKTVDVSWSITAGNKYWIAVQLDDTSTTTNCNYATSGGQGFDSIASATTCPDPFNGGALQDSDGMIAIYALYTTGGAKTGSEAGIGFSVTGNTGRKRDAFRSLIGEW